MSKFFEYTNEQLIAIIDTLDYLMEIDEHLLEANPYLKYEPFKFHNRMLRSEAHYSLKNMSFEEREKYNYPNRKKERET